ncbi:MAG: beta-lactamase family protein, partial [Chloroflexi bacterium]|nr:beta-lactamase family protein [Chloroflexota bacterium]
VMQPDSIFRLASMTKVVTTVALLMLFEEGRVRLTDPVAAFLPAFRQLLVATTESAEETVPADREVVIRDLLTHTSGVASSRVGPLAEAVQRARAGMGPRGTLADLVERLAAIPLSFQPGSAWAYSGLGGFDMLARIVEVVSGLSLERYFRERIFEPLGMRDTCFYLPDDKVSRLVAVYQKTDHGLVELERAFANPADRDGVYFSGAGGLAGTAEDYLRFGQMLLNGGELDGERLLSPKTVRLMRTNHIGQIPIQRGDMRGYRFGLGVQVVDDVAQARSLQTAGSFGWNGAFSTTVFVDPAEDMVHVFLTQTAVHPDLTAGLWADVETLVNQAIVA